MKAKTATPKKSSLPIIQRGNRFLLQKTLDGKQRQIPLGTDSKIATSKCLRFLATVESDGYQKALEELTGKKVIKAGCDPTHEEIETLYREFCNQSANPPRPETIKHNLARLDCLMKRAGANTIGQFDKTTLFQKWFKGETATPSGKRTFASAIRDAGAVFKASALDYYAGKRIKLENPFKGLELAAPVVSQFTPPPAEVIQTIFETMEKELPPHEAMIVHLAFCGLRRSEIEAIVPANFSKQADKVILSIEETGDFQPKAGKSGFVPITLETYQTLLRLRGNSDSPFFVPGASKKVGKGRLWEAVKRVNDFLKKKGLKNKPLHSCRKITGSIVAKQQGILEAAKVLRNTPQEAMTNYLGVATVATVDVQGSLAPKAPTDPNELLELVAKMFGLTVDQLKAKLTA